MRLRCYIGRIRMADMIVERGRVFILELFHIFSLRTTAKRGLLTWNEPMLEMLHKGNASCASLLFFTGLLFPLGHYVRDSTTREMKTFISSFCFFHNSAFYSDGFLIIWYTIGSEYVVGFSPRFSIRMQIFQHTCPDGFLIVSAKDFV